jgi:squalene synthase HpnC
MRPHVAAVYAYARAADDIADEGSAPAEERLAKLDAWKRRLHAAVVSEAASEAAPGAASAPGHADEDLIVIALAHSIRTLELPITLFDDLVSAFGQDTMTTRYDSWAGVFDYCRRSANPVGRLVLRIAGYRDEALDRSSDALCTALQLANFWQDFGRDWRAGRLYVPREVLHACGADESTLAGGRIDEAWEQTIEACVLVTDALFDKGRAVCDGVRGRLRYELRFTWLGGHRILDRVARARASLMTYRPTLAASDAPAILWQALRW